MSTEPNPPGGLELERTAEMPALPGNAALSAPDHLQATDSWRLEPAPGDEPVGPEELAVPEVDRSELEQRLRTLEQQLSTRDGWIAALESELEQREAQLRDLEAQLAGLNDQLLLSRALVEQLQARQAGLPEPAPAAAESPDQAPQQRLLVRTKGAKGIVHVLARRTTVGRTPDNDLRVDAEFVSRHHAVLLLAGSDTVLEDLNSTNGTFVNGALIARRTLREGDLVRFGKIQYRFVIKPPR
jgi:uncharacterized coiled-coil protein SlyX